MNETQFGYNFRYLAGQTPSREFPAVLQRSLGTLNEYVEVLAFQRIYNGFWRSSQAFPVARRLTGSPIAEDQKYGPETDGAMRKLMPFLEAEWLISCTPASETLTMRGSPNSHRGCLVRAGLTDAQVTTLHQAWLEWSGISLDETDPYADRRAACLASGGTWDVTGHTCHAAILPVTPPPGPLDLPPPPPVEEGLSTGTWFLLLGLGAVAAATVYYYVAQK